MQKIDKLKIFVELNGLYFRDRETNCGGLFFSFEPEKANVKSWFGSFHKVKIS